MEKIWAPWRMEYIAEIDEEKKCFLCEAAGCDEAAREKELLVLWRTEHWLTVMNRWPYSNGHLLIAPKYHTSDLEAIEENHFNEFGRLLGLCKRRLTEVMSPDGFNIGLNMGRVAGAGLEDHLHWHIVPRWNGDTNFMPVISSTKVIPQALHELFDLLRADDSS